MSARYAADSSGAAKGSSRAFGSVTTGSFQVAPAATRAVWRMRAKMRVGMVTGTWSAMPDERFEDQTGSSSEKRIFFRRQFVVDRNRRRWRNSGPKTFGEVQPSLQRRPGSESSQRTSKFLRKARTSVDAANIVERRQKAFAGQHHFVENCQKRETQAASQARDVERQVDFLRRRDVAVDIIAYDVVVAANLHDVAIPRSDRQNAVRGGPFCRKDAVRES